MLKSYPLHVSISHVHYVLFELSAQLHELLPEE